MATTLKDIARDLGVSVITVSKVLRDHPDISEGTRKRVLKRVKELDYQPNYAARALITGRTFTVGLVVPDLLHPFFASVAKAISKEIQAKGYSLLISSSDEEPELEQKEIHHLLARRVDVMIVASVQHSLQSLRSLATQNIPYILLDRKFAGIAANFVGVDDEAVGYLATSHLIEQGCERIAHIQGPEVSTANGRLEGYKRALDTHQIIPAADYVVPIGPSGDHRGEEAGYEAARHLLSHRKRPDGIFCFNDPVALGAMRAILEADLRIPEDIAVVGCGNLSYSDFLRVPLSSVDQGSARIGKTAAMMALKLAQARGRPAAKTELIEPHMVVRASSLRRALKQSREKAPEARNC
ncbi:MAG TPA: LacI family DNA-binding transcriptional regulator [Terracidiphilus sp.]|nr:LacI family DNA-binding transcriptional regulator [Terracidiphilus sp.]